MFEKNCLEINFVWKIREKVWFEPGSKSEIFWTANRTDDRIVQNQNWNGTEPDRTFGSAPRFSVLCIRNSETPMYNEANRQRCPSCAGGAKKKRGVGRLFDA